MSRSTANVPMILFLMLSACFLFFFVPDARHGQNRRRCHCRRNVSTPHRIPSFCLTRRLCLRLLIRNPRAPHQKPVAVDAVRRTGDQGHIIFIFINQQIRDVLREDHLDLVNFVCQRLIQNMDVKYISLFHLRQIIEHLCCRQRRMPGYDRMGPGPAHRQGTVLQVPRTSLQGLTVRPVIDRKVDILPGDLHAPHDAVSPDIQQILILCILFLQRLRIERVCEDHIS